MIDIAKISLIGFMFSALTQDEHTLLSWYGRIIEKFPWWLCKPLGGCYRCFVGQLCFWYLLIGDYGNLEILFLTSFGIMISMVYNTIYCYLK